LLTLLLRTIEFARDDASLFQSIVSDGQDRPAASYAFYTGVVDALIPPSSVSLVLLSNRALYSASTHTVLLSMVQTLRQNRPTEGAWLESAMVLAVVRALGAISLSASKSDASIAESVNEISYWARYLSKKASSSVSSGDKAPNHPQYLDPATLHRSLPIPFIEHLITVLERPIDTSDRLNDIDWSSQPFMQRIRIVVFLLQIALRESFLQANVAINQQLWSPVVMRYSQHLNHVHVKHLLGGGTVEFTPQLLNVFRSLLRTIFVSVDHARHAIPDLGVELKQVLRFDAAAVAASAVDGSIPTKSVRHLELEFFIRGFSSLIATANTLTRSGDIAVMGPVLTEHDSVFVHRELILSTALSIHPLLASSFFILIGLLHQNSAALTHAWSVHCTADIIEALFSAPWLLAPRSKSSQWVADTVVASLTWRSSLTGIKVETAAKPVCIHAFLEIWTRVLSDTTQRDAVKTLLQSRTASFVIPLSTAAAASAATSRIEIIPAESAIRPSTVPLPAAPSATATLPSDDAEDLSVDAISAFVENHRQRTSTFATATDASASTTAAASSASALIAASPLSLWATIERFVEVFGDADARARFAQCDRAATTKVRSANLPPTKSQSTLRTAAAASADGDTNESQTASRRHNADPTSASGLLKEFWPL
jgi:hypothetical protein